MLTITIGATESYDEDKDEFVYIGGTTLQLEHSLASLSKWESIFEKPFLGPDEKTTEEAVAYIQCMVVTPDIPDGLLNKLSQENLDAIDAYINAKMSATWFNDNKSRKSNGQVITSELLYYWMSVAGIDLEAQHWHLQRLFNLIKIFEAQNGPQEKMSSREVALTQREINARRRAKLGTRG